MGGLNISIHPLFFAFGLYQAFTGRIFVFLICTISAFLHELGHSHVAGKLGYRLNKITFMPYGAVASGEIDGLNLKDQIRVALAGPIVNLFIGIFTVALWWVFPETYAFTDVIAENNFYLALVNFLPIYPLDGGRVLYASVAIWLGKSKADLVCKIVGFSFAILLFALFVYSVFNVINISLLFFCGFILVGLVSKIKENKYVRVFSAFSNEKLKHGLPIKKIAIDKSVNLKRIMTLLDLEAVNEIVVYDNGKAISTITQSQLEKLMTSVDIYSPIINFI